jgi:hypothetical protein
VGQGRVDAVDVEQPEDVTVELLQLPDVLVIFVGLIRVSGRARAAAGSAFVLKRSARMPIT